MYSITSLLQLERFRTLKCVVATRLVSPSWSRRSNQEPSPWQSPDTDATTPEGMTHVRDGDRPPDFQAANLTSPLPDTWSQTSASTAPTPTNRFLRKESRNAHPGQHQSAVLGIGTRRAFSPPDPLAWPTAKPAHLGTPIEDNHFVSLVKPLREVFRRRNGPICGGRRILDAEAPSGTANA